MKAARIFLTTACIAAAVLFASACFAQQPDKGKAERLNISIKAKISYVQRTGYYMATTQKPTEVYFIVNPDAATLDALIKQGKPVTIDGHLTIGADQLFVEKINGMQYPGATQK